MDTSFASFVENLNSLITEVIAFQSIERSINESDREKVQAAKIKVLSQYSELLKIAENTY